MPLTIEPLDATLGAVVTGVRLGELGEVEAEAVQAAFLDHAVLVFPQQHLSDDEQLAFGARFGAFEEIGSTKGLAPISNVRRDGTLRTEDDVAWQILRGNEGWHTDSSYMPVSAKASILSAQVVPNDGGTTQWADMRAAYDALDASLRATVDTLAAHHSIAYSQARLGWGTFEGGYGFDVADAPLRPLVKVHPETGRRALFIGRHAHAIPGLDPQASEELLDALLEHACRPPRVIEHRWQPGDIVMWDNRCVVHRARPYDPSQARVMKHTRIAGDPVTERGLTP
jgi:alpha-ketoglutarate-dependent taurine dioxygenase